MLRLPCACWLLMGCIGASFAVSSALGAAPSETIIFGGDTTYPPFESLHDGKPKGFNIDLSNAIAEDGGVTAQHILGDWREIIEGLENGTIDAVPMFYSEERAERFLFTQPFYQAHHSIYTPNNSESAYAIDELQGRSVAVEDRSFAHDKIKSSMPDVKLVLTSNTLEALMALLEGRAEYAVLAVGTADALVHENDLNIRRIGRPIWPIDYAFAVRIDRPELQQWLIHHLGKVIVNGKYESIHNEWRSHLEGTYYEKTRFLKLAGFVMIPLLGLVFLIIIWNRQLHQRVKVRTRDLENELVKRREMQEELRYLSDYDPQTDLPKLHTFLRQINGFILECNASRRESFEILIVQMTDIGRITQTFGYEIAGRMVELMSKRIQQSKGAAHGYIGRGAFAIISEDPLGEGYMESIAGSILLNGLELQPNLSGGSATWPNDANDGENLVRCAETALAHSVERNRRWVSYRPDMAPNERDLKVVMDFRKTRGQQLTAVYQPQIDLQTQKIIAAESLVRWFHPELGFLSPATFIPLLEKTGLVSKVTEIMLSHAIHTAAKLRSQGAPLRIGVNISAHDLMETDLLSRIKDELKNSGGIAADLKLELTETSVAEDPALVREVLIGISELGVSIALDDFGTGFSSLAHLSAYPINEIKIDRTFVDNMLRNATHRSIVRSTIKMAHELGMSVVAEGAETREVVDALIDDGCDSVQGYFFSKPLPEADFLQYLKTYSEV